MKTESDLVYINHDISSMSLSSIVNEISTVPDYHTSIKGLTQSVLVNSALCHKASDGIVNCAHIVQYRRVVTEKEEPQQVSQLPSQTQGVKKIKTATYTLQGVMQKQIL